MPENYFCWGKSLICYVSYVQYFLSYLVIFFLYSFKVILLHFTYIFLIVFLLVLFLRKSFHFWREEKLFTQAIILSILFYTFIFRWIFCFYYYFIVYYFNFLSYLLYLGVKAFFLLCFHVFFIYFAFLSFHPTEKNNNNHIIRCC